MSYAVDFLIALICSIVAVLQIMQVKATLVYNRYVGPDGRPLPADTVIESDLMIPDSDIELEVYTTKSKSPHCAPPVDDGWTRGDDRLPTIRSYVDAGFGVVLAVAVVGLVLGGVVPTTPIAWMVFAAVALIFAVDLPRLIGNLIAGQFSPLVFLPQAFMVLGVFAAYRLI